MQAVDLKPGDVVEIIMTVTVSKVEHVEHTGVNTGPAFTAVEFNEFDLDKPSLTGRTTSAFTVEIPDDVDIDINLV